jgi:hypothetical protein
VTVIVSSFLALAALGALLSVVWAGAGDASCAETAHACSMSAAVMAVASKVFCFIVMETPNKNGPSQPLGRVSGHVF